MIPIKYTYRNLFERRGVAFMTLASIGFVVLVYIGVLALAGGLQTAFADTGDPSVVIVMRDGTRAEMESSYALESHRLLTAMPGVERTTDGDVAASGETVTIQIFERVDGTETNVMVRGVEPGAFGIRPGFEIAEGRRFEPGRGEIIVGRSLAGRLGLRVGDERKLGGTRSGSSACLPEWERTAPRSGGTTATWAIRSAAAATTRLPGSRPRRPRRRET